MMMRQSNESYRNKLISAGVQLRLLEGLATHELDRIGNLMEVYRDGETMETRDPDRYAIHKEAARRGY